MAPVLCRKTRVAYYPAPKNASTTLRGLFFRLDNGRDFVPFFLNGVYTDLFTLYRNNQPFTPSVAPGGYEKVAVVRDPIGRFRANYRWLISAGNTDIGEKPEINDFVSRFEHLRARSAKAMFHLMPQAHFLGRDLAYYDKVFKVEELGQMFSYLSNRAGSEVSMSWENRTKVGADELSEQSIAKLRDVYRADYKLLGALYGE